MINLNSSSVHLCSHSEIDVTNHINDIHNDCNQWRCSRSFSLLIPAIQQKTKRDIEIQKILDNDKNMCLIRFTKNGPVFRLSKAIVNNLKGSYIEEKSSDLLHAEDGIISLDYNGNDVWAYYLLDYLNDNQIDFNNMQYEEQLGVLDLFEFCGLPIPLELIECKNKRKKNRRKYEQKDEEEIMLIINGKRNSKIKDYLIQNKSWNKYIMNYDNGYVDYDEIHNYLYINKKYKYIEYIKEYIMNGTINIEEKKINNNDIKLLENEMIEIFGDQGRIIIKEIINQIQFIDSIILNKELSIPLINWLGKEKTWKLLFRASEHNYRVSEFHKYCDNKGETVTIIKHIGHNNKENIFGGYTDQNWESRTDNCWKSYSKEFLFTLSNEHNIPPTKYDPIDKNSQYGIHCHSSLGPKFGSGSDICIYDDCHNNTSSYCHARLFEYKNTPQKHSLFVNTNDSNTQNNFTVEDYEVWGKT
ncbi:hypothetical protein WA158_006122 [Blastocystis sp. Blastoise]